MEQKQIVRSPGNFDFTFQIFNSYEYNIQVN